MPGEGRLLRVVTANVHSENTQGADVAAVLVALDADVLVALEWTAENLARVVLQDAGAVTVLEQPGEAGYGVTLLARHGLPVEAALLPSPVDGPWTPPVLSARLVHDGQPLSLLAVHLPPPIGYGGLGVPAREAVAAWIRDGRLVRDVGVARLGDPVVVLGDFNALCAQGGLMAFEGAGLTDVWDALHLAPGPTWGPAAGGPKLLRLDAILAPSMVEARGVWVVGVPGSDHAAVCADLALADG